MASERKTTRGLGTIRTLKSVVDGRRVRNRASALLELSALASERKLLAAELERWKRRHAEIQTRLGEIAEKEAVLEAIVAAEKAADATAGLPHSSRPLTVHQLPRDLQARELSY